MRLLTVFLAAAVLSMWRGADARAQQPERPRVAASERVTAMTLVRSAEGRAVVRFRSPELHVLEVGDFVGQTRARVIAIAPGRLVLEDAGADDARVQELVVLRDGETGGRRFARQAGAAPPQAVRPEVLQVKPAAAPQQKESTVAQ